MTELNGECWHVIGSLGSGEDDELPPAALARLQLMGLVVLDDGKPRLTERGEAAYVALESGDDFPGLE
jgi:hypothetical protein